MSPHKLYPVLVAPRPDALIDHNVSSFKDVLEKSLSPKLSSTSTAKLASDKTAASSRSSRKGGGLEPLRANYQILNDASSGLATPTRDTGSGPFMTPSRDGDLPDPSPGSEKGAPSYVCTPSRSGIRLSISKSRSRSSIGGKGES